MTTLKDYVLNHRCPNCGLEMERKPPEPARRSTWQLFYLIVVTLNVFAATIHAFNQQYAAATFYLSLAVFLVVTDK